MSTTISNLGFELKLLTLLDVVNVAALAGDTIEIISKHYAHSFAERRAAAMEAVGASFAQLGNNPAPLKLIAVNE